MAKMVDSVPRRPLLFLWDTQADIARKSSSITFLRTATLKATEKHPARGLVVTAIVM